MSDLIYIRSLVVLALGTLLATASLHAQTT